MYGRDHATAALVYCLTDTAQFTPAFVHILVVDTKKNLAFETLQEDKLCDILQAMALTHVETVHQASLFHIERSLDW